MIIDKEEAKETTIEDVMSFFKKETKWKEKEKWGS
jgi:hypothetical protein